MQDPTIRLDAPPVVQVVSARDMDRLYAVIAQQQADIEAMAARPINADALARAVGRYAAPVVICVLIGIIIGLLLAGMAAYLLAAVIIAAVLAVAGRR